MSATVVARATPFERLLAAAWERVGAMGVARERVRVLGPMGGTDAGVTPWSVSDADERVLVTGWIGTHPDATVPLLARLWALEEAARAGGLPVLVLRFAPLVGQHSPLCAKLAGGPPLDARLARALVQPVHEADAIEGLARVLAGHVAWHGWYEVCGADPLTVGELAAAAAAGRFGPAAVAPAWEPPADVLRAMGLSEWQPWASACGVTPRSVAAGVSR